MLSIYNIDLIQLSDLSDFKGDMNVIYPIHLPLTHEEIISYNHNLNYTFQTHHEAIGELLKDWGRDILKVEVTGVKGKTSFVFMLKEILIDENPLILSSLGSLLYEDEKEIILKRDISITPANIKPQPRISQEVIRSFRIIAPATTAKTDSRLMMRLATCGGQRFCARICRV